jgi:hypothetical protein
MSMRKNPETIQAYNARRSARRKTKRREDPIWRESINANKRARYDSFSIEEKRAQYPHPADLAERRRQRKIEDPEAVRAAYDRKNAKRNADRAARKNDINAANRQAYLELTPLERRIARGVPEKHAEYKRKNRLKANFGLSVIEYEKMVSDQGNLCAICRQPEYVKTMGKVRRLSVDHNHTTGKVRGLLCTLCNGTIGFSRENISDLETCIEYLKRHAL